MYNKITIKKVALAIALFIIVAMMTVIVSCANVKAAELPIEYREHVVECSTAMNIDQYIVLALIETESGNDYTAINSAGNCFGLCQIHKCWERKANDVGYNIYEPYGNIGWCSVLLRDCYQECGDWNRALVKYNAGRVYADSSPYSRKIIARAEELRKEAENVSAIGE